MVEPLALVLALALMCGGPPGPGDATRHAGQPPHALPQPPSPACRPAPSCPAPGLCRVEPLGHYTSPLHLPPAPPPRPQARQLKASQVAPAPPDPAKQHADLFGYGYVSPGMLAGDPWARAQAPTGGGDDDVLKLGGGGAYAGSVQVDPMTGALIANPGVWAGPRGPPTLRPGPEPEAPPPPPPQEGEQGPPPAREADDTGDPQGELATATASKTARRGKKKGKKKQEATQ